MALTQISTGMLASGDGTVDLNIDNGTFVVDVSTSRVGVGNTTPSVKLDITGDMKLSGAADFNGSLDVDGVTNLDVVDIDGAVNMATTLLVTGVLTTTAATVFNGGSTIGTDKKIQFRDAAIHISSSADGQLDLVADTEIQIAATTIDINGNLDVSGTTVSAGKITADAGIDIDNFNIDGTTIALSSGDLTLDVAGSIIFDADGADYFFKNGGTEVLRISGDASPANVTMRVMPSNGDFIIRGNDGGAAITALTLDMSAGGFATFNNGIVLKNELYINNADASATAGYLYNDSNNFVIRSFTQDKDIIFKGNDGSSVITALTLDMSAAGAATFNNSVTATSLIASNGVLELDDNGSHNGIINAPASLLINIDSDNSNTGETFIIAKDRTGTSGGTVLYSISEAGNAEQKGSSSADFRVIAATDNATITLQAGASDSGAEAAMIYYLQNTTYKWEVGMKTDNSFRWHSYAANHEVMNISATGNVVLPKAGTYFQVVGSSSHQWAFGSTGGNAAPGTGTTGFGFHRWNGSAWKSNLYIGPAGHVGVYDSGTTSPRADMAMTSGTGVSSKRWGFGGGTGGGATVWYTINEGNVGQYMVHGGQAWIAHSDERIKENITDVGTVLPSLMNMRCVKYNLISNPTDTKIGFIAQDWESAFPEVVDENPHLVLEADGTIGTEEDSDSDTPVKAMAYTETIPLLLKAIQEQQSIITALTARITALEA